MNSDLVIIVTGGRYYDKPWKVFTILDSYAPRIVVEGNCPRGADLYARQWCRLHGICPKSYTADWSYYGKKAGFIRNGRMLRDWVHWPNVIVAAFPVEGGSGTQDCIYQARELGMTIENYGDTYV